MKRIKLIYVLLLAMTMPLLTACSSEDTLGNSDPTNQKGEKITVRFRVSQAGTNTMRAWEDKVAEDKEMMNAWVVVGVDTSNKVVGIWACKPEGDGQEEIDELEELPEEGTYRFYSFANMSPMKVMELLSIDHPTSAGEGKILASDFNNVPKNKIEKIAFSETTVTVNAGDNNIPVKVEGNRFNKFAVGEDNGFGYYGIPMSNVQTINNIQDQTTIELIVIRMLAKIKIKLSNDYDTPLTINSITLTDLTANTNTKQGSEGNNLMLLPNLTKGGNTMESNNGYHADIQPNLNGTPTQDDLEINKSTSGVVASQGNEILSSEEDWTIRKDDPIEIIFYVNESKDPEGENWGVNGGTPQDFMHYFIKIDLTRTAELPGGEGTTTKQEVRYTLIDKNKKENTNDEWNYIARNDYRIIPIVIHDFDFKIIPYDFPAIGVLPASVKEEDGIYTINFHDYGHFHLLPQVTKYSKPEDVIPYNSPTSDFWWTFEDTDKVLSTSSYWGTWQDASTDVIYKNEDSSTYPEAFSSIGFYKTGYGSTASADIKDGDEAGGEPVWYVNAAGKPRWNPADGDNYQPFIFGYIEDPFKESTDDNPKMSGDRKVYHEFTINLHEKESDVVRPMTYRLYMILDTDQMLYPQQNRGQRIRRPHCTH